MKINRRFTKAGTDVFSTVKWAKRTSRISNSDGSVVFEMKDAEVPESWSQLATDIMVSKYFRKAGVPQEADTSRDCKGAGASERAAADEQGNPLPHGRGSSEPATGPEKSARQVIHRLAGCWRHWGESHGYFDSAEDAQAFYDELCHMMLHQMAAPNSPQWFNTGLNWAYGITGPAQGHFIVDPNTGQVELADDAYTHPQPHACFIQSVSDDLVNSGGIMDLWVREARLFKYGSGTGTNFSNLRGEGEPLSGGGTSSGLMSWLKIGDRAAAAIKSGGTTRRAAKMVCLDLDHPDIEAFVNWKVREELKVAAMVEGLKTLPKDQQQIAADLGLKLNYDFNGEAYYTVSGQNSNNSVRIPDAFFDALDEGKPWSLHRRTDGQLHHSIDSQRLWNEVCYAAWRCADPGVQFDSTINAWHTCPGSGRINASNPCVTGDTLVATETGFRRIVDLVGGSATIINGDGDRVFVDRIFKTGTKPVFELKTASGYSVRLTADHRVRTLNRGDVPACQLTLDDVLVLERPGFGDDFIPEAFGEVLGAAVGDGCITKGRDQEFLFISLGESERAVAQHLQAAIAECKVWLNAGDGRGLRDSEVTATETGLRVGTSVSAVLERLRLYAMLASGSSNKQFTDEVFRLDKRSIAAILRGLFTADGTVANYGEKSQYVSLDSTSLELLRQVQMLLLGFGIKARIYENRRAMDQTKAVLPDGHGGTKEYVVQQIHSLRISRSSRVTFEREIGFLSASAKAARLAELNTTVSTYKDHFTDRVKSVVPCGVEDVYDLTEPRSHHFVANGIVVHNCSEYMFLDNTACNLASINLLRFYDSRSATFDLDGYEHAIRLWTIVLEISVLMAAFPSEEIARLSYDFRTLGLGFANIGAVLMQAGIPYDSEEARALCGCLTAVLCGRSYAVSAEMAGQLGAFREFHKNREHMLRVMRNHRRAAHGVSRHSGQYENLRIAPVPIDHDAAARAGKQFANADELLMRAMNAWDEALDLGERYGYRNAQTTVIAPTGTIGLLMDCDTTGVEPDFALVKFKKLAGGGYFKIANNSLRPALETLGYEQQQVRDILRYVMGSLSLDVPMPGSQGGTFKEFLGKKGFTEDDLDAIEAQLGSVFEVGFAFSAWSLREDLLRQLGIEVEAARNNPAFNLLREIGLTANQIESLNESICGTQTVEGAPHLKAEHLPVFDCANPCGRKGTRFIAPQGHIRMMAASQPFISGAISKTINLPNNASVEDIAACYRLSWELGLKANALYRDGCKLSQPLNTRSDAAADAMEDGEEDDLDVAAAKKEVAAEVGEVAAIAAAPDGDTVRTVEKIVERIVERPLRRRLPDTRRSLTHKFNVAGHEGYLTVGLYDDGMPGELFLTMSKEGSTIGGLMDSLGTAISVALQYGVPMESLVGKFTHQRFEPAGMTTNADIPFAKSLVDYIFRWMGIQFIPGYRSQATPQRGSADPAAAPATGEVAVRDAKPAPAGNGHAIEITRESEESRFSAVSDRDHSSITMTETRTKSRTVLDRAMGELMGDAPVCDVCGALTVRNGTCYKCMNCGNSMGCS